MENVEGLEFVISAPGKVILFGEHSVVYQKAAVSTAISRRLYVKVAKGETNRFCFKLPQINLDINWSLNYFQEVLQENCPLKDGNFEYTIGEPDNIDYDLYIESLKKNLEVLLPSSQDLPEKCITTLLGILFVFRGILQNVSDTLLPLTISINSDLEVGAGTGSSAAFAVAMAGTVLKLRKNLVTTSVKVDQSSIDSCDSWLIKSHSEGSTFSEEELKIINKWAFCMEKIMHGKPSGIDNTTCTFGSVVVASEGFNDPNGLEFAFLENIPKISILLLYTGVSRNTSKLVQQVRSLRDSNFAAVESIMNAMDVIALEAVNVLRSMGTCNETMNTELHNVLGGLMELNHGLLRTLGVSHDSLERIVSLSKTYGFSSKLTGAGGGGYAIALIPPCYLRSNIDALISELGPKFTVAEINIAEEGIRIEKT